MPVLFFSISAFITLAFLLCCAIIDNLLGRIFGYLSIPFGIAAILFAAYEWRKIDVVLLFVLSVFLCYLIASLIRIFFNKRRDGEEGKE